MIKDHFLLDPKVIFLNHGSFGACPRPVFEKYQAWQMQLELEPVQFLGVELDNYLYQARQVLGEYVKAPVYDLVYIPNATHGVNIVARSLQLNPGDEILSTDQEYGACIFTWDFICGKTGAVFKQQSIKTPICSGDEIVEQIWEGVTPKTKVLFLSHITSPTSVIMPVKEICQRASQNGIITIIDGAHAPGQLNIDILEIQPDFYVGNCHKWMLSPKGAGFLYARTEMQNLIDPLIVSWGYQSRFIPPRETTFIDSLQWTGTIDPAAALSVPAAIDFMNIHHWDDVRNKCHQILLEAMVQIGDITNLAPLYPENSNFYEQMGTIPIPRIKDITAFKAHLFDDYRIEVPVIDWNGSHFIRISVQGYNTVDDIDHLLNALKELLPTCRAQ